MHPFVLACGHLRVLSCFPLLCELIAFLSAYFCLLVFALLLLSTRLCVQGFTCVCVCMRICAHANLFILIFRHFLRRGNIYCICTYSLHRFLPYSYYFYILDISFFIYSPRYHFRTFLWLSHTLVG